MSDTGRRSSDDVGHRQRLRQRFSQNGAQALADYELLELLLTFSIPRKNTKPMAKALLQQFGSLGSIFRQPSQLILEIKDVGPLSVMLLQIMRELWSRALGERLAPGYCLSSPEEVARYLQVHMGYRSRECVLMMCLNSSNTLLHQEIVSEGTVNHAPIYPREVARTALQHGATAVILAHNHPGGQCRPSPEDEQLTRQLSTILNPLGINLHDHLVVTTDSIYSIKARRVIHLCSDSDKGALSPDKSTG